MTIQITNEVPEIKIIPSTTIDEIIQNIRMIISVAQGSVPLYRDFGIDTALLDSPINLAKTKLTAHLARQIQQFEPRAKLKSADISGDLLNGNLIISVIVEV